MTTLLIRFAIAFKVCVRCGVHTSAATKMINVLSKLRLKRSVSGLFSAKDGQFIPQQLILFWKIIYLPVFLRSHDPTRRVSVGKTTIYGLYVWRLAAGHSTIFFFISKFSSFSDIGKPWVLPSCGTLSKSEGCGFCSRNSRKWVEAEGWGTRFTSIFNVWALNFSLKEKIHVVENILILHL